MIERERGRKGDRGRKKEQEKGRDREKGRGREREREGEMVRCQPVTMTLLLSLPPALIAEVILYSEGFESSKNLAQKMTQMYKLCSEQLSQQDHYDFGMRAVKSVLVMAGSLKRQNPDKLEDVVLIRALRDSNLPKFLQQDALLFQVSESRCVCRVVEVGGL